MRTITLLVFALLVAGCSKPSEPDPVDLDRLVTHPGECDVTYPDGTQNPCEQQAAELSTEASPRGVLCSDASVPGPQGSVQLQRDAVTNEVFLALDLTSQETRGIAWVIGDARSMWSWNQAAGDDTWSLGQIEAGKRIRILVYTFSVEETNTSAPASIEQLWTRYTNQAYALHHVVVDGREYFFDRMLPVQREAGVTYELASFEAYAGPYLVHATHKRVISVDLTVQVQGNCSPLSNLEPVRDLAAD